MCYNIGQLTDSRAFQLKRNKEYITMRNVQVSAIISIQ